MRKRNRKKKQNGLLIFRRAGAFVLAALALPAVANWVVHNLPLLETAGEKMAVAAAVVEMPGEGMDYVRDRFAGELYLDSGHDTPPPEPQVHVPPAAVMPEQAQPAQESSEASQPERETQPKPSIPTVQPDVPEAYRKPIISENFAVTSVALIQFGAGSIRNDTRMSDAAVQEILETPMDIVFEDTAEPQVLIVHTHATEAFEPWDSAYYDSRNTWRSQNNDENMVAVGTAMAQVLEQNGIGVIHDDTQHDYPSYNGSYERSAATIQAYLDEYPSIKVVLDLHRDAMERDGGAIVKPVIEIDGKKAAQIMIIAACDDDGTLGVPEFRKNLRFAAAFQSYMEQEYHQLTRPVYFSYRKYNMDKTTGSLLLEFGSNANTLEEAVYAAELCGQALSELIWDYME